MLLIILIASCKKEQLDQKLVKEFSIQSTSSGANYKIKVALPDNYNPLQKYATVYVLDGDENLSFVAQNSRRISADLGTSNVLVVSIGYGNNRTVDYTPTKAAEGEGGAEKFMMFIKNDLIPKVETEYEADSSRKNRVILGHSFGGLFASYAFANHNEVFGNYIMLSPSLWYDNEVILTMEKQNRNVNRANQQLVFMGLGELENEGRMHAPFMAFYQTLKNNYPAIKITRHLEPQLDHMGSKDPNILAGLKFYFQNR